MYDVDCVNKVKMSYYVSANMTVNLYSSSITSFQKPINNFFPHKLFSCDFKHLSGEKFTFD